MNCNKCGYEKEDDKRCRVCNRIDQRKFYLLNRDKVLKRKEVYRSSDEYKIKSKKWEDNYSIIRKKRPKTFKVKFGGVLRAMIKRCLDSKKVGKSLPTYELLGYDTNKLKQRIECQFKEGMSWDNYGKWHIDHRKPISKFNSTDIKLINSLCNLQPLWKEENLSKGSKF